VVIVFRSGFCIVSFFVAVTISLKFICTNEFV